MNASLTLVKKRVYRNGDMHFKIFKKVQKCMVYIHILNCHYRALYYVSFVCSRQ